MKTYFEVTVKLYEKIDIEAAEKLMNSIQDAVRNNYDYPKSFSISEKSRGALGIK